MSLDDEIAHLRDLDLHGLRARWKSMLQQSVISSAATWTSAA